MAQKGQNLFFLISLHLKMKENEELTLYINDIMTSSSTSNFLFNLSLLSNAVIQTLSTLHAHLQMELG